jgi:hypothetical protein
MSTIGSMKLFASGVLAGIAWHEITRRLGGRRHRPARDHAWLSRQVRTRIEWDGLRGCWLVWRDGRMVGAITDKDHVEQLLDSWEPQEAGHRRRRGGVTCSF